MKVISSSELAKIRTAILNMKIDVNGAADEAATSEECEKLNNAYDKLSDAYDALCEVASILDD